jgi:hypothetical protein
MLADYGSSSDDAEPRTELQEVIDVDQLSDSRMNDLRKKWTAKVRLNQQSSEWKQIVLPDSLIEKLESMMKSKSKRAKDVRTSWSPDDKQTVMAVFEELNRLSPLNALDVVRIC